MPEKKEKREKKEQIIVEPEIRLPMMTLREVVMFPRSIVPLFVGRESSIRAIERALNKFDKQIFLVTQKNPEAEDPVPEDLFDMGTVSRILQLLRLPDGTIKVLFEGLYRATWSREHGIQATDSGYPMVLAHGVAGEDFATPEALALIRAVQESLQEYAKINKKLAPETLAAINSLNVPGRLADSLMPHLKVAFAEKQTALEEPNPLKRLEKAYEFLLKDIELTSLEKKVKSRVKQQMERNHRDFYLNEQIKAIQKEMGRGEEESSQEIDELAKQLEAKELPEEAKEKCAKEIKKLRQMPPQSAEFTVVRNYVDWILSLPWNTIQPTSLDLKAAQSILDEDHFALDKPKERILEYLAVQSMVEKLKGPILCLVGPPGVGKTSLAKSVARAMGREFVRISLGGVRDEAEIRGHRRTYIGALPGKIIQSLRRVKFNNPVFCLDEVDKMSTDFRGDPSAALLEVLDPEQNAAFADHYLDLDYDLSKVFFITTANTLHSIPGPLQDRMEIIRLPGYLEVEKLRIAKDFLMPRLLTQHGLTTDDMSFSEGALLEIIRRYTREAGVRNLEREMASICRKVARKIVEEGRADKPVAVNKTMVGSYLGVAKFRYGEREERSQPGVATGLAWTEMGGELLLVEVSLMPGTGKVEITGKLGDVMQESARAAWSYVRSRSDLFGLRQDFYKEIDIHIHVPEGATPKDGPSAGITLATSVTSALLNLPVNNNLAMTGEITLRGRVLPIGGVREKLLAAHRGLISKVIIPADNAKDLKEVPANILKDLEVITVEHMDEVLCHALTARTREDIFCVPPTDILPLSRRLLKEEHQPQTH
ncbi:endopeptidase La [Desulfonatronum thioautotrophicum]|uniref:endopeptidase La n=1 Tax=Desulfonatronum thioautotrophicum TaxID=617001 RepID=UPI0005EB9744|nr:endopeptidase La [Desulfonatronum thioautotrophicum]